MSAALYGLKYVLAHYLPGQSMPLIRGLVLTNRCNLRCKHCRIGLRGDMDLTFEEVVAAIDSYYAEGGRCLYLEGGEPFLWRDGSHDLEDIVVHARGRGYLTVVVYTNGTFPLNTSANTVFISIDGLRETHDYLRGSSFDRILENIRASTHPSIYVNYTINRRNRSELRAICQFMATLERVRAVFFYFHTPYYGMDSLYLPIEERRRIILELLELRKEFKILNSRAGLWSAYRNDWTRPVAACSVYEKGRVHTCCRNVEDPGLCEHCGYLSYAEIDQTLKLKPSAIANALKYF